MLCENNVLATELETYEAKKAELLANDAGRFVLIKGTKAYGVFDTDADAYSRGVELFGPSDPFLVKEILSIETSAVFVNLVF